jgi:hypothetical protein
MAVVEMEEALEAATAGAEWAGVTEAGVTVEVLEVDWEAAGMVVVAKVEAKEEAKAEVAMGVAAKAWAVPGMVGVGVTAPAAPVSVEAGTSALRAGWAAIAAGRQRAGCGLPATGASAWARRHR